VTLIASYRTLRGEHATGPRFDTTRPGQLGYAPTSSCGMRVDVALSWTEAIVRQDDAKGWSLGSQH